MTRRFACVAAMAALLWPGRPAPADAVPAPSATASIKLVGQRRYETSPNSTLTQGQLRCSAAAFFRLDSEPKPSRSGAFVLYRQYYGGPTILLRTDNNARLQVTFMWTPAAGARPTTTVEVAPGVPHHVAMTWDGEAGEQWCYVDGVGTRMASLKGQTIQSGNLPIGVGGNEAGTLPADYAVTIDDVSVWDGYALTPRDVLDLRDGRKAPRDVGGSASRRVVWSFDGQSGGAPGAGGVVNALGGGPDLSVASGPGSATYAAPLDWSPTVRVAESFVTTSGGLVAFSFRTMAGGAVSAAQAINTPPTFRRNGIPLPPSDLPVWITGFHDAILVPLPESVRPGDVVTVDAPGGWARTTHGLVAGLDGVTLDNRSGRSSLGPESAPRTLRPGVNFSFTGTGADTPYAVAKNLVKRLGFWNSGTQATPDGRPVKLTGTSSYSELFNPAAETGIDNLMNAGPLGLHAIGWDDTDPANPDEWSLESLYGTGYENNAIVTERADLRNDGTPAGGKVVGKVRVFDIRRAPDAPRAAFQIAVRVRNKSGYSRSENLAIHGPGDFTHRDGEPVVLDRSDPHAVSEVFKARLRSGAGSFRWMDTITYYTGGSPACEPEHVVGIDDFRWGYNRYTLDRTVRFVQARPYVRESTYLYSPILGDRYDVELAEPVDATSTTLRVRWSDANPVIPCLRLYLPSDAGSEEVVRVVSIPDAPADGQVVDVVVDRGRGLSVARPHAAGTIKAGYRVAGPPMADLSVNVGVNYELVSDRPHGLWSGVYPPVGGTWPKLTFADGTAMRPNEVGWRLFVTGPRTVVASSWWSNASATTLPGPVTLDPAACYTRLQLPTSGQPTLPFEYAAHATGQVPGCDLWLNIPHLATDDLVVEIARRVRDRFPPGRRVYVELSNEPWNGGFPQAGYFDVVSRFRYPGSGSVAGYASLLHRAREVWALFEAAFDEGGRGRSGEVRRTLNFQPRAPMDGVLTYARTMDPPVRIDACATAPYVMIPDGDYASQDHQTSICQFRWPAGRCVDLFTIHLSRNLGPHSFPASFAMQRGHIDAYNAATGNACTLVGYEGGVEFPITAKEITPPGSVAATSGSPAIVGTGTKFLRYFSPGQSLVVRGASGDRLYRVDSVASDTSLALAEPYAGPTEAGRPHLLSSLTAAPLAGTVAVEAGKPTVVGTGTAFDRSMVGRLLGIRQPDGVLRYGYPHHGTGAYQYFWIKSVADATHLTLERNYNGATAAGCRPYDVVEHADAKARDMVHHPSWYHVEHDFYRLAQASGFDRWSVFCYAGSYFRGRYLWPIYTWLYQEPGYGDGRDGRPDNRLHLAEQGLPNSKPPSTSLEHATVSVRGQALIDWNAGTTRPADPWRAGDSWEVAPFDPVAGYGPATGYDSPEQAEAARLRMLGSGYRDVHLRHTRTEVVPPGR